MCLTATAHFDFAVFLPFERWISICTVCTMLGAMGKMKENEEYFLWLMLHMIVNNSRIRWKVTIKENHRFYGFCQRIKENERRAKEVKWNLQKRQTDIRSAHTSRDSGAKTRAHVFHRRDESDVINLIPSLIPKPGTHKRRTYLRT